MIVCVNNWALVAEREGGVNWYTGSELFDGVADGVGWRWRLACLLCGGNLSSVTFKVVIIGHSRLLYFSLVTNLVYIYFSFVNTLVCTVCVV